MTNKPYSVDHFRNLDKIYFLFILAKKLIDETIESI